MFGFKLKILHKTGKPLNKTKKFLFRKTSKKYIFAHKKLISDYFLGNISIFISIKTLNRTLVFILREREKS